MTIFRVDGQAQAIWVNVGRKAGQAQNSVEEKYLETQETKLTSESCQGLKNLAGRLEVAQFSLEVSRSLYFPSVTYQIWSTSPVEARYLRFHRPDDAVSSVASWGDSTDGKAEIANIANIIEELFEVAERCREKRQK